MNRSDYFALRINHFLKGYRKKNGLTQTDLAAKIKATKSTVSRIENGQDKQVHEVLAMLERLGQLEGMDLGAFLVYLDGKTTPEHQSTLFPWQVAVMNGLGQIKQSVRLDLVSEVMAKDVAHIESLVGMLIRINRLPKSSQMLLEKLLVEMKE